MNRRSSLSLSLLCAAGVASAQTTTWTHDLTLAANANAATWSDATGAQVPYGQLTGGYLVEEASFTTETSPVTSVTALRMQLGGDAPEGAYEPGQSQWVITGALSGAIYDTPGTYRIRLRVSNGDAYDYAEETIVVDAP